MEVNRFAKRTVETVKSKRGYYYDLSQSPHRYIVKSISKEYEFLFPSEKKLQHFERILNSEYMRFIPYLQADNDNVLKLAMAFSIYDDMKVKF